MTRNALVVDRRALLTGIGGAMVAGCASESDNGECALYPAQTEGPFYLASIERQDITEGLEGAALTVRVTVVESATCAPVAGAVVEIWHTDAGGVYSGFPGQLGGLDTTGEDFLRGAQPTAADGVAEFGTIYPGWYPGRTTHIHLKVHIGGEEALTSQLYFPEDVNAEVYASGVYAGHGQKDTANEDDIIDALQLGTVTGDVMQGYIATVTLAV